MMYKSPATLWSDVQKLSHINEDVMLNLRDTLKEEKRKKDEMGFAGVAWPEEKNWIHLFLCNDV